jgi:hypothetical protein
MSSRIYGQQADPVILPTSRLPRFWSPHVVYDAHVLAIAAVVLKHLRRKWPFMLNWGCGEYSLCAVGARRIAKANQSPGITTPWLDSTQNSSVNGYSAAPGHIPHRPEEGRTDMLPLRAAELVSGLWRCDERLLWHLFALGPSCLGQY